MWSAKSISVMSNSTPSLLAAEQTQHQRYVQRSSSEPSICVTSLPVSLLNLSIAPIVGRHGYSLPSTVMTILAMSSERCYAGCCCSFSCVGVMTLGLRVCGSPSMSNEAL